MDVEAAPIDRDQLVIDNLPLVRAIVSRDYSRAQRGCIDADDLFQAGCIGLIEAARSYRPERGPFRVWASLHINACICKEMKLDRRRPDSGSSDAGLASAPDRATDARDLDTGDLDDLVRSLPSPYRQIIIRTFGLDWGTPLGVRALARLRKCSSATICKKKNAAVVYLRGRLTA